MNALAGSWTLLKVSLRHDGRSLVLWIVLAALLSSSSVVMYPVVYETEAERQAFAATMSANPALGLVFGPGRDLLTSEGFNAWRSLTIGGFLVALGAIFAVIRATRRQEDSGQAELMASGVLGRGARLWVGIVAASLMSILAGGVSWVATVACGADRESTAILCATFTVTGLIFAGVAAVTSQIAVDASGASTWAVATLGTLFVWRGLAYSFELDGAALWLNPLSWMIEADPAIDKLWWPLWCGVVLAAVLVMTAFLLQQRRDFGQGLVVSRPGPSRGHIHGPAGLAWRLNRAAFATWLVVALLLGVVFGYFASSVEDLLSDNPTIQLLLASGATSNTDLVGAFVATIMNLMGIILAVPGVQTVLNVRREEVDGRLECVLATAVSRTRYYLAQLGLALLASGALMMIAGTLLAVVARFNGVELELADMVSQAGVTIPAIWMVIAIAVLIVGVRPQLGALSWAGVLVSFLITLLGPTLDLSEDVMAISPFHHVPAITVDDHAWAGLISVAAVAVGSMVVGLAGFRRRDLYCR